MRCDDAQSELLAGRTPEASGELAAHVRECASCQALAGEQSALSAALALDQPHSPGPGFDTRFFARLDGERSVAKKKRALFSVRMWLWALVPAAAGVALLVSRPGSKSTDTTTPPEAAAPAALFEAMADPDDLALLEDLDLIQELDVVQQLDQLEDLDLLEGIEPAELDQLAAEVAP